MTDDMLSEWVRQFDDGQTYVHDEPQVAMMSNRPSVANDELVVKVNENFCEKRHFTTHLLCDEFPRFYFLSSSPEGKLSI